MATFKLGVGVRDIVTGFSGRVTGHCQYITGCDQYLVQPEVDKDDKFVEPRWLDENRLVRDSNIASVSMPQSEGALAGPDAPAPAK